MISALFNVLFPEKNRIPSPSREHQIGTQRNPYFTSDSPKKRRIAIKKGVYELRKDLQNQTTSNDTALSLAIESKRKRLILIRTLHRNKATCSTLHADVLWMYAYYKLDASKLKFDCNFI